MGTKYPGITISGYNNNPPPDDGSQAASNLISWSGIKGKIGDPVKTAAQAIDSAVATALNLSCRAISSNDSTVAGDHWKTLELSNGATLTLIDASTAGSGYAVKAVNVGTSVCRITRATSGDFINGVAIDLNLNPGDSVSLKVNAATNGYVVDGGNNVDTGVCEGRISASSGIAVPTSDVSSSTSIFLVPYKGNKIALFDGTGTWSVLRFGNTSVACPTTSSTPFDVFAFNNAGVVALETASWTNASSRATGITLQDGVLVKVGATTRRYLGTCCTIATPGNIEDTYARRFVWNYYNRIARPFKRRDTTDSWTYSTNSFQQANASALNQIEYIQGVSEDPITVIVIGNFSTSGATLRNGYVGIGIDSVTVNSAIISQTGAASGTSYDGPWARFDDFVAAGRHVITWLEAGAGTDTQTWYGDNGAALFQTGLQGEVMG